MTLQKMKSRNENNHSQLDDQERDFDNGIGTHFYTLL